VCESRRAARRKTLHKSKAPCNYYSNIRAHNNDELLSAAAFGIWAQLLLPSAEMIRPAGVAAAAETQNNGSSNYNL
jgi:hypothetical protein